ncbi:MAG: energy-coupling factor ABC transporter ATP-binding protein [Desulfovibrio sp.]|uniref:energy-coupling factor ABC transporter ATP-binding protein n=1 Tax=Desulfovibrio sp. 7SRBS1 TaxID=3378064 RepID=UPI003B3E7824
MTSTFSAPKDFSLELRDIIFAYPSRPMLLDKISLRMDTNSRIGLIGSNGTGKTTLARIALGLETPTQGQVFFMGAPVSAHTNAADFSKVRERVGYLFQNPDDQLFCPTVLEDVAFGPLNQGLSPENARITASRTLTALGLDGFEGRVTHKLSGGEKKLVALASIMSMLPSALILDEPTNDLDPETRTRLIRILGEWPGSLLVISHDWDFLTQVTNTVMALENGKLRQEDGEFFHQHRHIHPHGDVPHTHEG